LFEDLFAGARFTEHQAESALLGMNSQDVEDFLLLRSSVMAFSVKGLR